MSRVAVLLALVFLPPVARAEQSESVVKRGLTGELSFTFDGPELVAEPSQDLSAPLLLRLDRDPVHPNQYTARYIAAVGGEHDLRSLVCYRDGSPAADDLPPLIARVISSLPAGMETDLYDAADLDVTVSGGYKRALAIGAGLWLAAPIVVVIRRLMKPRRAEPELPPTPAPTLADQLRPLVEAAAERELTVAERARLELLLYHDWRGRVAADAPDVATGVARVRQDPAARELIHAVEGWLHHPDHGSHDPDRLSELLSPYLSAPAIDEAELAQPVGAP